MRIFALSDIHVDFELNQKWIEDISASDYVDDTLLLAGDVCHTTGQLEKTLLIIKDKFKHLFFVPGNHDLWIHGESWQDSRLKWDHLAAVCRQSDIEIEPRKLKDKLWIVPLLSWYSGPEEGMDSLYLSKKGEDPGNRMWSDNYYIKWPNSGFKAAAYFAERNEKNFPAAFDAPVISFSHFIPREEMMFSENREADLKLMRQFDRNPQFNFSRVAGSTLIEDQLRRIGSFIHVYGHQHRNREREIDGVRYISHCLGYPKERKRGSIRGIEQGLKQIWEIV